MEIFLSVARIILTVIVANYVGKLVSKIKLPAILGWLIVGIVLGPFALNLMSNDILESQAYYIVTKLLECSVGIMFAKDLIIKKIRKYGKQIITITLFESIGTFVVVSAVFAVVFYFMNVPLYLAIVFGGIALATAPAPALSIVNEFKTKGPVTNTLVPLAILDDVVAIVVFFSINSYVAAMGSSEGESILYVLSTTVVIPVIIGIIIGYLVSFIYKKDLTSKGLFIVTIVTVVITFLACFSYDTFIMQSRASNYMLVGMALFTTVANIVGEEKIIKIAGASKHFVSTAFVIMILNLAAPLDYRLIFGAGLLTAIYIISRGLGKYYSTYLGAKLSKSEPTVTKYLGFTLLPHSGVSLVFTGMAVNSIIGFDNDSAVILKGTIAAAAIINEVFAVIIAKKGFEWAKEMPTTDKNLQIEDAKAQI